MADWLLKESVGVWLFKDAVAELSTTDPAALKITDADNGKLGGGGGGISAADKGGGACVESAISSIFF